MRYFNKLLHSLISICIALTCLHFNAYATETITVTDIAKRTVTVPKSPQKIICVAPGTLRLVCYLGAQDKLVGIEKFEKKRPIGRPYWLANPELAKLPVIGPGGPQSINGEPDLEAVLKVKPDVIFISYMKAQKADALQRKLGIPVVVVSYGRFASFDPVVYESIRLMGKIVDKEKRSEEIVAYIETARKDLLKRAQDADNGKKVRVYVGAIGYKGFQGIESTDASYVPLEWVKAQNVAKNNQQKGHMFIDKEKLMSWNPDIIFIDAGGKKLVMEDYRKKPKIYKGLNAVRNNAVRLLLPFNWYMTNIGTAIADAYTCGKVLYPEKFSDVNLSKKADEIYTFFVGKPVYQQMKKDFGELGAVVSLQ